MRADRSTDQRGSWFVRVVLIVILIGGATVGGIVLHRTVGNTATVEGAPTASLFHQASKFVASGQLNNARKTYRKILKIDPLNVFAYYDIGDLYQSTGQTAAAANAYEEALLIKPNYSPALFNLAVLETPTDPTTTITLYKKLESIEPKVAAPYFNLALLELHLGMNTDGNKQLIKAVHLDPSLYSRIPPNLIPPGLTVPTTTAK